MKKIFLSLLIVGVLFPGFAFAEVVENAKEEKKPLLKLKKDSDLETYKQKITPTREMMEVAKKRGLKEQEKKDKIKALKLEIQKVKGVGNDREKKVLEAVESMIEVIDNEQLIEKFITHAGACAMHQKLIERAVLDIKERKSIKKFFIGPDYKNIEGFKKLIKKYNEDLQNVNDILSRVEDGKDKALIIEQLSVIESAKKTLEEIVSGQETGFSLFGWLVKRVKK